jgi:hypothetical protein
MHWDFYTALSALSGIVLMVAGLGGPAVGTARERLSIFALGAFSLAYGIWVATQVSGFFLFSVAPALLAVMIIIRAVQHAARPKPPAGPPAARPAEAAAGATPGPYQGSHAAPPAMRGDSALAQAAPPGAQAPGMQAPGTVPGRRAVVSALRAAQPERVRQAVPGTSAAFCPAFHLPGSAGVLAPAGPAGYYLAESLGLGWSVADGRPRLPPGEELLGLWQARARVKVAVDPDLSPAPARHDVSWVTVLDGTGLIALSRQRVMGILVRGDSLLGIFDQAGPAGIALWCLPLRRVASASVAPAARDEALLLSSAEPAGHVSLTEVSAAGGPGLPAAGVPPGHLAELINRARAELP